MFVYCSITIDSKEKKTEQNNHANAVLTASKFNVDSPDEDFDQTLEYIDCKDFNE